MDVLHIYLVQLAVTIRAEVAVVGRPLARTGCRTRASPQQTHGPVRAQAGQLGFHRDDSDKRSSLGVLDRGIERRHERFLLTRYM